MPPDERECPRCGAPVAEAQEYCLECGARIPDRSGLVSSLGSAWRRRLGWYPGDWIWPALLTLLVAAAAAVASAVWLADRSSSANGTLVFTGARSAPLPAAQGPLEPTSTTPTTPATTQAAPAPARAATLTRWPPGKSGWTIVLDSVPTINGRAGAVAEAKQALRLGLKQVGVIDAASYSSLHPGYFVIFTGVYDTQAEAQSHIIDAHRHGYRGPYPRPITP